MRLLPWSEATALLVLRGGASQPITEGQRGTPLERADPKALSHPLNSYTGICITVRVNLSSKKLTFSPIPVPLNRKGRSLRNGARIGLACIELKGKNKSQQRSTTQGGKVW